MAVIDAQDNYNQLRKLNSVLSNNSILTSNALDDNPGNGKDITIAAPTKSSET